MSERLLVLGILIVVVGVPSGITWARRFYGPKKMQRAQDRFDPGASAEPAQV